MPVREIRSRLFFVATVLAFFYLAGNSAQADESLRIQRPVPTQPELRAKPAINSGGCGAETRPAKLPTPGPTAGPQASPEIGAQDKSTAQYPTKPVDCGGSCCKSADPVLEGINCPLPPPGLFEQWRAEFVSPTLCPILMCHGSCRRSNMSCKLIKPMLDSLLDAFSPEEPPAISTVNFRCCAGFTED